MEKFGWKSNGPDKFTATISLGEIEKEEVIARDYQLFIEKWRNLHHPALFPIKDFYIGFANINGRNVLEVKLTLHNMNGFSLIEPLLSTLVIFEKIFILKQTLDLAYLFQKSSLPYNHWQMMNLYLHPSGQCRWMPLTPHIWTEEVKQQNHFIGLVAFALNLFGLGYPYTQSEWKELEYSKKLPLQWILFLKNWTNNKEIFFSNYNEDFKAFDFVFYQSWIYSIMFRLSMKDNLIYSSEYGPLQKIGSFLGLQKKQLHSLEILSQMKVFSWADLETILKNNSCENK